MVWVADGFDWLRCRRSGGAVMLQSMESRPVANTARTHINPDYTRPLKTSGHVMSEDVM
jgi:hypothetical protein